MSNFVIEIKAPELAGAMEKLAAALMNKTAAPAANPTQTSVPVAAPAAYTFEQLRTAAGQLVSVPGKQAELIALLGQFGVQALTLLPQEQYDAFATELRRMGAKI